MKRIERDFIALFNCLWYRDFPISGASVERDTSRADWTIHIGLVVRQCATLLGARALFEKGNRTDAIMRFPDGEALAHVEWEWKRAHTEINEIEKLARSDSSVFCAFVGYSREEDVQAAIDKTLGHWQDVSKPLIFFLITYEVEKGKRRFKDLRTYVFARNKVKKVRSQAALPWEVNRSKLKTVADEA